MQIQHSVFVKRRQPAKVATYFSLCAGYFDRLIHRLYYKAVNMASFLAMSAGYFYNLQKTLTVVYKSLPMFLPGFPCYIVLGKWLSASENKLILFYHSLKLDNSTQMSVLHG